MHVCICICKVCKERDVLLDQYSWKKYLSPLSLQYKLPPLPWNLLSHITMIMVTRPYTYKLEKISLGELKNCISSIALQYLSHLVLAVEIWNLHSFILHLECYKTTSMLSLVLTDTSTMLHVKREPWVTKQALTLEQERGGSIGVWVLQYKLRCPQGNLNGVFFCLPSGDNVQMLQHITERLLEKLLSLRIRMDGWIMARLDLLPLARSSEQRFKTSLQYAANPDIYDQT